MNRSRGWLVVVVGLGALALSSWWLTRPDEGPAVQGASRGFVVPVVLTSLERGDLAPRAELSGTVRAARRAQLGFDTGGLLAELHAREAEAVEEGALLANLESGDEEREVETALASQRLAARQYDLLVAGERDEVKKRLEAVLAAAVAEAKLAALEVERGEKLLADRILSQAEQDARVTAFEAADERRAAAEQEYAEALAGTRKEDLDVASARVDEARARVERAHHELSKTRLLAPWSGSIVRRYVSPGDYVSAGDPVFELVDLEHLEVHVEIPARFAPRVSTGSSVRLTLTDDERFELVQPLFALIPAADDAARSFRGIIRIGAGADPLGALKPGMFVRAELDLRRVEGALVVDSDAVLANEHGNFVVRAAPGPGGGGPVAEMIPVRVLARAEGRSAVEALAPDAALAPGDALVLTGGDNAFPGASLLPREREAAPAGGGAAE